MNLRTAPFNKVQRTCNWCDAETSLLLDVWCDQKVQVELRSCPRNQPVFDRIALYLQKNGYNRSGNQCREKVKTLKKEYNYAMSAVKAGTKKTSDFRFWHRLEGVLMARPNRYRYRYMGNTNNSKAAAAALPSSSSTRRSKPPPQTVIKQEVVNLVSDVDIIEDCGPSTSTYDGDNTNQMMFASPAGEQFPDGDFGCNVPTIEDSYQIADGDHSMKAFPTSSSVPFDQARLETVIEAAADKVVAVLNETQARLIEFEEKRMKFEAEQEERRRKENRDHEIKLLNSVGQMFLQAIQVLHQKNDSGSSAAPILPSFMETKEQLNLSMN